MAILVSFNGPDGSSIGVEMEVAQAEALVGYILRQIAAERDEPYEVGKIWPCGCVRDGEGTWWPCAEMVTVLLSKEPLPSESPPYVPSAYDLALHLGSEVER